MAASAEGKSREILPWLGEITAESRSNEVSEAERALQELAQVFLQQTSISQSALEVAHEEDARGEGRALPVNSEAKYRALVEQIPAVVFMAYLDKGIGEAYVSPRGPERCPNSNLLGSLAHHVRDNGVESP